MLYYYDNDIDDHSDENDLRSHGAVVRYDSMDHDNWKMVDRRNVGDCMSRTLNEVLSGVHCANDCGVYVFVGNGIFQEVYGSLDADNPMHTV